MSNFKLATSLPDHQLQDKAYRNKLEPKVNPYWRTIEPGTRLGYLKGEGDTPSKWVVQRDAAGGKIRQKRLADVDDWQSANGEDVLSYEQAADKALEWSKEQSEAEKKRPPEQPGARAELAKSYGTVADVTRAVEQRSPPKQNVPLRLRDDKRVMRGFADGIRGLRAVHEAIVTDSARAVSVAAEFFIKAAEEFEEVRDALEKD